MTAQIDVFTDETFEFVSKYMNFKEARVLEIGCGTGEFGLALQNLGASITAIDTDEDAIKSAKEKGLNAQNIAFLDFKDDPFDAVIFTRSLHHIHELEKILKYAKSLLKSNGTLQLEEFALENVNQQTTLWYYDTHSIFSVSNLTDETFENVAISLEKWEEEHKHEHPLNTGEQVISVIEKLFTDVKVKRNAYLYRSICSSLSKDKLGYEITKQILSIENRLIKNKLILPHRLRVVADK